MLEWDNHGTSRDNAFSKAQNTLYRFNTGSGT
jgi:hypothetical protein